MKPETIEESGIEYSKLIPYVDDLIIENSRLDFIAGAKWQQEKSFDDMQYYMEYCLKNPYITPQEWILNHKHY